MRLYLVQHGHALSSDLDPKPLSPQGLADVERVAAFLARAEIRVSAVFHSGKLRARQTAEILAGAISAEEVQARGALDPNDPVEPVAKEAQAWADDRMLVGHLPFMAKLASRLIGGSEDAAVVAFQRGTVVCLERAEHGGWTVHWMIRPELLSG